MQYSPTDEILSYLREHAPDELRELRERYPEDEELVYAEQGLGPVLGETEGEGHPLDRERVSRLLERAERMLANAHVRAERCLPLVRSAISRAHRFQRLAAVTTLVGGSALMATIQASVPAITYAAGALTLAGALLTLWATEGLKTWAANGTSMPELHERLQQQRFSSESALEDLSIWRTDNGSSEWGNALTKQAEAIAREMNLLLARVPGR